MSSPPLAAPGATPRVRPRTEVIAVAALAASFAGLTALWHWFNHSLPAPDDSSFLLGSIQYADLLSHPKFWKAGWWYGMLTVNRVYPPTVMVFNGVLRLLFGPGYWVYILSDAIFTALLTACVYGSARLLGGGLRPALLAAVLVNLYPQITTMSHGFALDAPLVSMVGVGLLSLLWWRSNPSWGRAVVCGVALGLSCLTKQIAAAYLLGPGVFCLAEALRQDLAAGRWQRSRQLVGAALLTGAIGLPWLLVNIPYIRFLAQDNQANMGALSLWQVFPRHIAWYANSLPSVMSPLLMACFVLSLFLIGKKGHGVLLPLALSAAGGVLMISTLTWAFPSLRYVAPALVATAIYSGFGMSRLFEGKGGAVAASIVLAASLAQFVSFNFSPYPISQPSFVARVSETLGVALVEKFGLSERDQRGSAIKHSYPRPAEDWGQEWALRTIDVHEGGKPVWLNILPDYVQLNGNTFELVARMIGSPVRPTTSRRWTVMGDRVSFDPQTAMYFQWYLLKSGGQGNLLRDEESERNYARLIHFVEQSGRFDLIATHPLPDGSTMFLYRQK
jgi:4-amino-4-deoxy-L-arabinose transferase-like glycosyltransferase